MHSNIAPSPRPPVVLAMFALTLAFTALLAGCSAMQDVSSPGAQRGVAFSGNVHGGQQPVTGSHVYLYSAGVTGYGSAATSMLMTGGPGTAADTNGNNYVTTDANGNFSIAGDFTCSNSLSQVYLLAVGGNPGLTAGTTNSAITLIAAIGNCSSITTATVVDVNEVSTAAAVTALQQFMVDSTHIGSSTTNAAGIANAFLSVQNMVTLATGSARSANLLGTGAFPQSKLNTLADILSPCINSAGPSSSACSSLFSAVTPSGGTMPADVAKAMLLIAQNPTHNTGGIFGLIDANAPFAPTLSAAPNDYTLGMTYTGGGLTSPGDVAIDANGAAWMTNCPSCNSVAGTDSIVGFGPQGAILTGSTGYTTNIHMPQGVAFDSTGDLWSTNLASGTAPDQIVRMTPAGTVTSGFPFNDSTLSRPVGIATDGSNSAWVTNQTADTIVKITSAGTRTLAPVTSPGFSAPTGVGIDGIGVIFAAGSGSNSILKFDTNGNILSGSGAGYTGAGLAAPIGVSLDNADNVWTIDNQSNAVSILYGASGTAVSPSAGYTLGLYQAAIIAIDGLSTAWIANCRGFCGAGSQFPDDVVHLNSSGAVLSGQNGYQDTHFATVGATAIDASGNLWVTNNSGASITELLGVAAPIKTPITAGASNSIGSRP